MGSVTVSSEYPLNTINSYLLIDNSFYFKKHYDGKFLTSLNTSFPNNRLLKNGEIEYGNSANNAGASFSFNNKNGNYSHTNGYVSWAYFYCLMFFRKYCENPAACADFPTMYDEDINQFGVLAIQYHFNPVYNPYGTDTSFRISVFMPGAYPTLQYIDCLYYFSRDIGLTANIHTNAGNAVYDDFWYHDLREIEWIDAEGNPYYDGTCGDVLKFHGNEGVYGNDPECGNANINFY